MFKDTPSSVDQACIEINNNIIKSRTILDDLDISGKINQFVTSLSEQREENGLDKLGISGVAAGPAIMKFGPIGLKMFATTFGKTSIGVAINTLHGAAAANAQLAYLGGGGMALGANILALCNPIGIGVAVLSAAYMGYKQNKKNHDDSMNLIEQRGGIHTNSFHNALFKIEIDKFKEETKQLRTSLLKHFDAFKHDVLNVKCYRNFDNNLKMELDKILEKAISLSKRLNVYFRLA
ncbi:hypothetical protein [Bacillus thuringiensis]|uniref:hypothetical protein n=1 Tax=Bacillus thuringiensis TaxID=1428 RepID=UPI003DA0323F